MGKLNLQAPKPSALIHQILFRVSTFKRFSCFQNSVCFIGMVETDPNHSKTFLFQNKLNSNGVVWTVAVMGFCPHSSSHLFSMGCCTLLDFLKRSVRDRRGDRSWQEPLGMFCEKLKMKKQEQKSLKGEVAKFESFL